MSEQDNFPVGDADQPRDMTPDELEEALRWLEDLAGRQGKSLDGLVTLDDTALEDSPFKGLFDSDEQELPDWLREVPSSPDAVEDVIDGESRLDWLARMSSRESVEELPTLEWRRLTEGEEDEDGDLVDAMPEAAAAIAGLPAADDDQRPVNIEEMATLAVVDVISKADSDDATTKISEDVGDTVEETPDAAEVEATEIEENLIVELTAETPTASIPLTAEENVLVVSEAIELDIPDDSADEEMIGVAELSVTGPDDLDEAMAWLEELAASQDAPVEDLPSVADRALASKLIADAASGVSQIEGADSSQMGIAMSGIYVGKTRLAPTGPLVGEPPADETPDSAIYAEVSLANESDGSDDEADVDLLPAESADTASEPDALAKYEFTEIITDEIDFEEIGEEVIVHEVTTETIVAEPVDISETIEAPPGTTEVTQVPSLATLMNGSTRTLPELLTLVDYLAIPDETSLDEIDAMLAADPMVVKITPFTLGSTLDWLEGVPDMDSSAELLDSSLVDAMPDDPDEAQVWLEQMAEEIDTEGAMGKGSVPADVSAAAMNVDLTEADLLDMPEDPDAAIAWIESLAAKREAADS